MPTMGVYAIRNKVTGRIYIGSSTDIESRYKQHVAGHEHLEIRRDVDAYGREALELIVLEEVIDPRERAEAERRWYAEFSVDLLYNKCKPNHYDGRDGYAERRSRKPGRPRKERAE